MEKGWILIVRIFGVVIGFSPFFRNLLFHWGLSDEKYPLTVSDGIFIVVGFIFVWGSSNFGTWANHLGKIVVDKLSSK